MSWGKGILILACLGASFQEEAAPGRSPEELAAACAALEDALAAQPNDRAVLDKLSRLYALAGAKPLLSGPGAGPFKRLDDRTLDGAPVRCYREGDAGEFHLVVVAGAHYRSYYRTEGPVLVAKVGGFGPLRSLAREVPADPAEIVRAAEKTLPDLRMLEETGAAIRNAAGTDAEPEVLTKAAERLRGALVADGGRLGLLEELVHVYDRLGEITLGSGREPEYRRLQLNAAAKLAEALPEASTTQRSLALVYFRLSAYPLAAAAAARAKDEPLAETLAQVLKAWSQDGHEKLDGFEVDGGFLVDVYRTTAAPPESGELFAEQTFIVRRPKRAEFAVYTLSSQQLKSERHYYIYFSYLGQRTLLTTYASKRPQDAAVKEKVATLIRRLAETPAKNK